MNSKLSRAAFQNVRLYVDVLTRAQCTRTPARKGTATLPHTLVTQCTRLPDICQQKLKKSSPAVFNESCSKTDSLLFIKNIHQICSTHIPSSQDLNEITESSLFQNFHMASNATEKGAGQSNGTAGFKPLKITIVGAGIGGLMAAIGLRRNGHDVSVRTWLQFHHIKMAITNNPP